MRVSNCFIALTIIALGASNGILTRTAICQETSVGDSLANVQHLVTHIVRDNIPHTYEDKKKWGMTEERWDGLHIQLKGLRLKTKRRKKHVNHGNWKMYRIELLDPNQELDVRIENVRQLNNGRIGFDTYFTARVHAFGRTSKWVKGAQLYSFSADANAKISLHVRGDVGVTVNVAKLPPDVGLDPKITLAELHLHEFDLYRVSNVGGELAQQLGRSVRRILENKIADANQKLPDKLNRQIAKKKDKLQFSMHDLVKSKWSEMSKHVKKEAGGRGQESDRDKLPVEPILLRPDR